jgi:hypothetical protein
MENSQLLILKNFERDNKWFNKNLNKIRKKGFTNKFVAIKEEKIISSEGNISNLIKLLEKKGENPSYLFIEFVYPEGFTLIL